MKIKNKGKIYPSPSPSSSSSPSPSSPSNGNHFSLLKLLPASILVFISALSIEDREVLAYLITRSIKTTAINAPSSSIIQRKASNNKKAPAEANGSGYTINTHKPPVFDCDCFDCYTSYWFKWDSSPNRELIHRAIEAFEDHLTNGETDDKPKRNGKAKRRDKTARRFSDKNQVVVVEDTEEEEESASAVADAETLPENEVVVEVSGESIAVEEEEIRISAASRCCSHKGLARKMLPDVLGLLNSRLWSLWCPNA